MFIVKPPPKIKGIFRMYGSRILQILLVVAVLFGGIKSYATPSGGATFPPQGKIEAGYEYNVMFDRSLRESHGSLKTQDHFFTLSFGIFDWLSLDGKIGIGGITHTAAAYLPRLEYKSGFAGGYGFRVKVFDHAPSGIRVIIGAQHISVHPQPEMVNDNKYRACLDDWQLCGVIAKNFKLATPYVGIKGSDCEIIYDIDHHGQKRYYSKDHIGFLFGSDFLLFDDKVKINIEVRFFDETGLSTAITYRF